jgi:hypothetical protein
METLLRVLDTQSPVVIAGQHHWWPTREQRLARKLQAAGHQVVFTETE